MKKRVLFAVLALVFASLSCNLPLQDDATPFPESPSPTAGNLAATFTPEFTRTLASAPDSTEIPPVVSSVTPVSTLTPEPATATAMPTLTASVTVTKPPASPTPPPTVTVAATKAAARTATSAPSTRVVQNAAYFNTPPVLDGVWDEWKDRSNEYPAGAVVWGRENWDGDADLEASFRAAWDEDYLYLAVKVKDDVYVQNAAGNLLYEGDSIEVLLDTKLNEDLYVRSLSPDDFQLGISPGNPDVDGVREAYLWFPRSLAGPRPGVKIAAVRQSGVYRVEIAIPWRVFEVTPASGMRLGFALSVSDNDNGGVNAQQSMVSNASGRVLVDPTTWTELRLK